MTENSDNQAYNSGHLDVGDGHALYFEEHGNAEGKPVVFLHGGPGGGFNEDTVQLFDMDSYRIILFDQRGAGQSKPFAEIRNNTIPDLVEDIERLRIHFGIEQWMVVGGSWGSALAMLYAIEHPDSVTEIIISGTSLADPEGANWFVEEGGASRLMPDWFAPYRDFIPAEHRNFGLAKAYYNYLMHGTEEEQILAAKRFDVWDTALLSHNIRRDDIQEIRDNPEKSMALARVFFHFYLHEYKQGNKWKILDGVRNLEHIPCHIIHGRYDLICPAENAWALYGAYPNSKMEIIQDAGHSILDPAIAERVREITDLYVGAES